MRRRFNLLMTYMEMSKIKSTDQLLEYIDESLKSRKLEISFLKMLLKDKIKKKSKETIVLSKALVLVSYSHYEGFVKNSSQKYFEYLNFLGLKCKDLPKGLLAGYIHSCLYSKPLSAIDAINKVNEFISSDEYKVSFNVEYMADTESNLNSVILEKLIKRLDLPFSELESNRTYIDSVILKHRNQFAHGELNFIDTDKALEISDKIIYLLDSFSNELQNHIVQKNYLRKC